MGMNKQQRDRERQTGTLYEPCSRRYVAASTNLKYYQAKWYAYADKKILSKTALDLFGFMVNDKTYAE